MGPIAWCLLLAGIAWAAGSADVEAGARIFRSHCAECHGLEAEGARCPNLRSGDFYHGSSDAALLKNISEGIPGTEMPGLYLDEHQIRQLIVFLRSLPSQGLPAPPSGDPVRGRAVYQRAGCAACHAIGAEGGRLGPELSFIGSARTPDFLRESILEPDKVVHPRFWVFRGTTRDGRQVEGIRLNEDAYTVQVLDRSENLRSFEKTALQRFEIQKRSLMPSYRDQLNTRDLDDLVAFLYSRKRPREGQ